MMRSDMMKSFFWTTVFFALTTLMFGCANPAENAPEAVVEEPAETTDATDDTAAGEVVTYTFAEGSSIGFVGSKVTGSHDGGFNSFEGQVDVAGGDLGTAQIGVTIDTTSLWADNDQLTGHLKSADFFDVETYPTASFNSTAVAANEDGTHTVTGNLDLHGVTKQISFPATIALGDGQLTAQAEFSIKRFDFNIVYPGKPDDLIREEVLIKLDLTATPGDAAAGEGDMGAEGEDDMSAEGEEGGGEDESAGD